MAFFTFENCFIQKSTILVCFCYFSRSGTDKIILPSIDDRQQYLADKIFFVGVVNNTCLNNPNSLIKAKLCLFMNLFIHKKLVYIIMRSCWLTFNLVWKCWAISEYDNFIKALNTNVNKNINDGTNLPLQY